MVCVCVCTLCVRDGLQEPTWYVSVCTLCVRDGPADSFRAMRSGLVEIRTVLSVCMFMYVM